MRGRPIKRTLRGCLGLVDDELLAGDLGVNHRPQLCLILWFLPLKRDPGSDSLLHNERHL